MRVVVELTQREADELMRWDGGLTVLYSGPFGDIGGYAIPGEVRAMVDRLREAILKAEAFAKAHP